MSTPDGGGRWDAERVRRYRARIFAERDRLREALADGAARQRAVLADLLEFNAATAFGKEHGFASIRTLADFRKSVPIMDYSSLSPWLEQMAGGASNILTADDPVVYFTSSGSTGAHKKIPVTPRFMRTTFFPFYYAAWAPMAEHFPDVLTEPDAVLNLKHDPAPVGARTASGRPHLGASQVDFGIAFGEPLSAEPGSATTWATLPDTIRADDHLEKEYARLRCAVEADVRCVIGINPAMVAALPYQLRLWWARLMKDVHDGTLNGAPFRTPNPGRARELERLAAWFGRIRPAHVWPNMKVIFCWTTGLAALYLPRLREEFGTGVRVLPAPVAASEGPVGVALDRHRSAGDLVVTAAVHEFIPADEPIRPDAATLEPHELEAGHEYHVVFSHVGGLYRYAVHDVIRVVDVAADVPRVEYAGRDTLSDVSGERLRESQVIGALAGALGAGGLEIGNASCRVTHQERADGAAANGAGAGAGANGAGAGATTAGATTAAYEFALAPRDGLSVREAAALAVRLDDELARRSPGYLRARTSGRLAPPLIRTLDEEAFLRDWHDRVARGVRPTQVKDRLFRSDPADWDRLTGPPPRPQPHVAERTERTERGVRTEPYVLTGSNRSDEQERAHG